MRALRRRSTLGITSWAAGLLIINAACFSTPAEQSAPRTAYFIGIDVSGSFLASGRYDDALAFTARYIHAHLNARGDLTEPRALFVGAVGGNTADQAQGFHPIHDFRDKGPAEIEADLRTWFPPDDRMTDFNTFFQRVSALAKRHNLILAPIDILVMTDGVPDVGAGLDPVGSPEELYPQIDLQPLEYLARNVTVRLLYPDPDVAVDWERRVDRARVRLWTVDRVVMRGWRDQLRAPGTAATDGDEPAMAAAAAGTEASESTLIEQPDLWRWMKDNVDFRVRRGVL